MARQRPNRRDFMQPGMLRALAAASDTPATREPEQNPRDAGIARAELCAVVARRAMACDFAIQFPHDTGSHSFDAALEALDLVEALEAQMTVYRDNSEIVDINRRAALSCVAVESRLFEVLLLAQELFHETGGALDITAGPLSDAWGFSRREGRIPSEAEIAAARDRVGMGHVVLDADERTIAFAHPGVAINLNSIGKGYALDRMAEQLVLSALENFLLHGGKSSVLAQGDQPGSTEVGWVVGLRHPLHPAEPLGEFRLHNEALSTSGSGTQFFMRRGRRFGHILDPRTGWPAEGLHSATVIAPTSAEADALSTAFYVMGVEAVADYCTNHEHISALLVAPAEREGGIELFAFNLTDAQWRPASRTC